MSRSRFRRLAAYRISAGVAQEIHDEVVRWEKFEKWTLGVQLVRAADSIPANIAEAMGRLHAADRRRLLLIARGSLYETEHWIECAAERGLIDARVLDDRMSEVARTLAGLIRSLSP